jgi:polysaccharide export outer membrane protein
LVQSLKAVLVSASLTAVAVGLAGCADLPSSGPDALAVMDPDALNSVSKLYDVIDIDPSTIDLLSRRPRNSFAARFGDHRPSVEPLIGVGDMITVTIWEASSGGLFSSPAALERVSAGANSATIPEQVVGRDGAISVPYAGRVQVAGHTTRAVQEVVQRALEGKAIQPQVLVTDNKPISSTITIGGEGVGASQRLPLSVKGDRLLDVIAEAGGVRMAVNEIVVVLQRNGVTERVPLQRVTSDPHENIFMRPGDVVTLVRDPQTFIMYGATISNGEVPFGTDQLTLAQALAKVGGLADYRADAHGIFVFRLEQPAIFREMRPNSKVVARDGRIPVVYHLDLSNPNSLFLEQRFQIAPHDLLYVSNAPSVQFQKAVDIFNGLVAPVSQSAYAASAVTTIK